MRISKLAHTWLEASGLIQLKGVDSILARDIVSAIQRNVAARDVKNLTNPKVQGRVREAILADLNKFWGRWSSKYRNYTISMLVEDLLGKGVLENPEADALFGKIWFRVSSFNASNELGSFEYKGEKDVAKSGASVNINLPYLLGNLAQGKLKYNQLESILQQVIGHELRHAAEWCYLQVNQSNLRKFDRAQNVSDKTPLSEKYHNMPTEIRSWAGNFADEIYKNYGKKSLLFNSGELLQAIQKSVPMGARGGELVLKSLTPDNKRLFLTYIAAELKKLSLSRQETPQPYNFRGIKDKSVDTYA